MGSAASAGEGGRGPARALVLCPGRGSYTAGELGYLSQPVPAALRERFVAGLERAEAERRQRGDPSIRELDGARGFGSAHAAGQNAAPLIFSCTAFDFLRLDPGRVRPVAVGGNSLGWYSALYVAGALGFEAAFRLVDTMGRLTAQEGAGGQLIYPVVGDDWRADPERARAVAAALAAAAEAGLAAGPSIHFGGFEVLWAEGDGLRFLLERLPPVELGAHRYPFQLRGHAAFHSELLEPVSRRALHQLADLPWRAPGVALIDGRGVQWRPLTTDPEELYAYTLGHQVVRTFDFGAVVRVGLREYAPDVVLLLGPGDTLGAAVAQVLIRERWQGIDSREAFLQRQERDPLLISMARPRQAERVVVGAAAS